MEAKAKSLHAAGSSPLSTPGGEGILKSSVVWGPIIQSPEDHTAESGPWTSCQHLRRLGLWLAPLSPEPGCRDSCTQPHWTADLAAWHEEGPVRGPEWSGRLEGCGSTESRQSLQTPGPDERMARDRDRACCRRP